MEPVRVAVVGLGYWGPNLVRNLYELPEAELAYVCDLRPDRLDTIALRYPAVRRTSDLSTVFADDSVDAVVIATPVSTHYELARAALEAGKHVLVEKPLATTAGQAEALIELAGERDRIVMPGHTFLYSPSVLRIKQLIETGELGQIYFISSSRVNLGLHQPDISVVWDLGPHDISILLYWLGEPPSRLMALSRGCVNPTIPDVAFVELEFPSGTIAHVELSWLAPSKLRRTAIVGTSKMVVYDDMTSEPVRIFDSGVAVPDPMTYGEYRLTYRTGDIVSPHIGAAEPLCLELADFCAAIATGREPRSSAPLGLEVVRVLEAVDRALGRAMMPVRPGGLAPGSLWAPSRANGGPSHPVNVGAQPDPAREARRLEAGAGPTPVLKPGRVTGTPCLPAR